VAAVLNLAVGAIKFDVPEVRAASEPVREADGRRRHHRCHERQLGVREEHA
jgi:hypothetical protein